MESLKSEISKAKLLELESFKNLYFSEDFKVLCAYINKRAESLNTEINNLNINPGLDTAFKIQANLARIQELRSVLSYVEFKAKKFKEEILNG